MFDYSTLGCGVMVVKCVFDFDVYDSILLSAANIKLISAWWISRLSIDFQERTIHSQTVFFCIFWWSLFWNLIYVVLCSERISLNRSEDNISVVNHNLSAGERLFYYVMNSWMSLTPPRLEYVLEECTYSQSVL